MRLLARIYDSESDNEHLVSLGFRGEKLELASKHFRNAMADPVIAGYIADRVLEVQNGQPTIEISESGGIYWHLVDRGVSHLPQKELLYYFKVQRTVLGGLSRRDCGLAVKDYISSARMSDATGRAIARLNTPALKHYYRIQLKAARIGAKRAPVRQRPAQEAHIEAVIADAIISQLENDQNAHSIVAAIVNPRSVGNRQACTGGRIFMDTVLNLKGRDLHDGLIYLSTPRLAN